MASLVAVVTLSGVATAVLTLSLAQKKEVSSVGSQMRALYMAEAGISESLLQIAASANNDTTRPVEIGTNAAPQRVRSGRFWADIVDNGDRTFTVTSTGASNLSQRSLQAVVAAAGGSAFDHAIFAGNSSGDPTYTLNLSGTGLAADSVSGDIYAGGDVALQGDAAVSGDVYASGTISGGAGGDEGVRRPILDIASMDYANNNDYDVAARFAANGTPALNDLGGTALQLPEDDPAHIFRLNPDDRTDETSGTPKDDYFLEDPYMPVTDFTAWNGREGHTISFAGAPSRPGPDANDKVYYIDGNLWVHNKPFGRLRFMDASGAKATFVVRGNVYFSDDVLLHNDNQDGVAFIAIKDENEPDSGNVYLGDPRYGTIERLQAFLYAENNFYDFNLDETGSSTVELFGNMTAGNQVKIQRDFEQEDGTVVHSKLSVNFDDRISTGALVLPGIPQPQDSVSGFKVVLWREAPNP